MDFESFLTKKSELAIVRGPSLDTGVNLLVLHKFVKTTEVGPIVREPSLNTGVDLL